MAGLSHDLLDDILWSAGNITTYRPARPTSLGKLADEYGMSMRAFFKEWIIDH